MKTHQFTISCNGLTDEQASEVQEVLADFIGRVTLLDTTAQPQCDGDLVFVESFENNT
jgi:hypothetical protein